MHQARVKTPPWAAAQVQDLPRWAPTRTDRSGIRMRAAQLVDPLSDGSDPGELSASHWQLPEPTDVWGDQSGTPVPPPLPVRRRASHLRLPWRRLPRRWVLRVGLGLGLLLGGLWMGHLWLERQAARAADEALALGSEASFRLALGRHRQASRGAPLARRLLLERLCLAEHGGCGGGLAPLQPLDAAERALEAARLAWFYDALAAGDLETASSVLPTAEGAALKAEHWRARALLAEARGDAEAAVQAAQQALHAAAGAPRQRALLARLLLHRGQADAALSLLTAPQADASHADLRRLRAEAMWQSGGDVSGARSLLQQSATQAGLSQRQRLAAEVALAVLEQHARRDAEAGRLATAAWSARAAADAPLAGQLAALWVQRGDLAKAKQLLQALPAASQPLARAELAVAERDWQAAAAYLPQTDQAPAALLLRGAMWQAQGKWQQAAQAYQQAARAPAQRLAAQRQLVLLQVRMGQFEAAKAPLQALLPAYPQDAALRIVQGLLAEKAGQFAEAQAALQQALAPGAAHQDAPPDLLNMAKARLALLQGGGQMAVAVLRPLAEAQRDAGLWNALGQAYLQAEVHAAAKQAFERALTLEGRSIDAQLGLAVLAMRQGQLQPAQRLLDAAQKVLPSGEAGVRARWLAVRAALHFEYGELGDAEAAARQATALDPSTSAAFAVLANIDEERKRDPVPSLRRAMVGSLPSTEAMARLALVLGASGEGCQLARRYLQAAPQGYDAAAVQRLVARCR